jgi:hypothetical protein
LKEPVTLSEIRLWRCRENIMRWCEEHDVGFILGLVKNKRLGRAIGKELHEAQEQFEQSGQATRVFKDFTYRTRKSWSRERRVVGKAEQLSKGANPRFVVTSLSSAEVDARTLYEDRYCARGDKQPSMPDPTSGERRAVVKQASKSSNCFCSPIGPALRQCGPIKCASGFRRWLTCYSSPSANSV